MVIFIKFINVFFNKLNLSPQQSPFPFCAPCLSNRLKESDHKD